jgi:hypothetical protein
MLTGPFPPAEPLLVMAAWAVIFGWLSVRMFKWQWDRHSAAACAGCPRFEKGARGK